jgi:hypothetical protein
MSGFMEDMKTRWLDMLTPPWRDVEPDEDKFVHIATWIIGWIWALAGILLGAVFAPYLLEVWGFADSAYQDIMVIGVATLAGFLVQFFGWCLIFLVAIIDDLIRGAPPRRDAISLAGFLFFIIALPLPLLIVGYVIYLYATTVGTQNGLITTGVIGGVFVKLAITLGLPLVKSLFFGILFAGFIRWLRGGKAK